MFISFRCHPPQINGRKYKRIF
ncbi:unnamed protein product [Leptidea sinapis]|uniref:Uncharacterized protein n=1 Tax=Leptidea sinapis TaxID=189913 RepID=A0A5E4PXE0_9NEOP|nr:unnamed protein product [Leptidea sinapis]